MTVICNIYKDVDDLLPHFLKHYMGYGIRNFLFGIHEMNPKIIENVRKFTPDGITIQTVESYKGQICGTKEGESFNRLRLLSNSSWIIPADLDEFHLPCEFNSFNDLASACQMENANYVKSILNDCITPDGSIPHHILPDIPIKIQFPNNVDLTKNLLRACNSKICLALKTTSLTEGNHSSGNGRIPDNSIKPFSKISKTLHYKWFGNLKEKEEEKYISYKSLNHDYCRENFILLEHLKLHGNKLL